MHPAKSQMLAPPAHSMRGRVQSQKEAFAKEESGILNVNFALGIVGVFIVAVVGMAVVAALMPTYFSSLSDVGNTFTDANTTTGNTDADALLPIFGLLVAFAGLFAIVGLVILVVRLKRGG